MEALKVEGLSKNFGGIEALKDVTFSVGAGEKLAIIGPNGAGKTTLLNVVNGQHSADSGHIYFMGNDVTRLSVYRRAHLGMGRAFQSSTLFPSMTVLNNLLLAIHGMRPSRLHFFRSFETYDEYRLEAERHLKSVNLWLKRGSVVSDLSHGEQKRLEIAMSLALGPKLLLLDEPSAGLTTGESGDVAAILRSLGRTITILIVAHDMDLVFGIADHILVLHYGEVLCRGTPNDVQCNAKVREIYMGVEESADDVGAS
ncbi:MAG TPA: ABC transporter ATP-binding protein [Thermodesulfobacteriota bacterium]|nr:ABC transporter ATP-binding protein [Thermodesulfobacteriota bacterium]